MDRDDNPEVEAAGGGEPRAITDRAKMAVPPDSQPGLELDGKGNQIPFEKRTEEDQEKAKMSRQPE